VELGHISDDRVIALARDSIASDLVELDPDEIERVVRDELEQWRSRARVQTFVPVFAQRSARARLTAAPVAS
jgi:hypothetical protein